MKSKGANAILMHHFKVTKEKTAKSGARTPKRKNKHPKG